MQNGENMGFSRGSVELLRGDSYSEAITSLTVPTFHQNVVIANRSDKRVKPPQLTPRYGTASEIHINCHNLLQKGIKGPLSSWKPYSSFTYRETDAFGIENQWLVCNRTALIGMDELSPLIQNKIREEIMSGKAQLAVDLVELRKTKSMMADAAAGLWHAYRDLRAGRPFHTFVREMKKTGFRSYAGNKWLEYIYGWAPTVSGAFETADLLSQELQQGTTVLGKVRAKLERKLTRTNSYGLEDVYCVARAKGYYQYTIKDAKLLRLTQLGFTNPLSVAWELMPWSFVLDWFVDVGGYINRMDFALGLSDIYWQYSCNRKSYAYVTYTQTPLAHTLNTQPCLSICTKNSSKRSTPSRVIANTFKGLKPFTNETVRLTSAVALLNQQTSRIKRVR